MRAIRKLGDNHSVIFIQLFVANKVSLFMYVLRRTVIIVNSTGLHNCYIDWNSCSDWRLEESRIHDPNTITATESVAVATLRHILGGVEILFFLLLFSKRMVSTPIVPICI